MTDIEKLVQLLDDFNRDLSTVHCNEKYIIWDDHVELAKYLLANNVIVMPQGKKIADVEMLINQVRHNLITGADESGMVSVEEAERWFIKLLENAVTNSNM